MKLGRGRIGACVVMVSLFAAIIGGWALSTDVSDTTVTTYESVADITGFFESSNLPTSIEYNPGDNYTGYTTTASAPFFGGVDYTESARANNYQILQPSTTVDHGYEVEVTSSGTQTVTGNIYYGENGKRYTEVARSYALGDFIAALNLTSGVDRVDITSIQNYTTLREWDYIAFEGVLFFSKSWARSNDSGYTMDWCALGYKTANPTTTYHRFCLSASVDLTNNTVSLYYDNVCTELCGIYTLDDVMITKNAEFSILDGRMSTGTVVNYTSYDVPPPKYMEISRGVYWS